MIEKESATALLYLRLQMKMKQFMGFAIIPFIKLKVKLTQEGPPAL